MESILFLTTILAMIGAYLNSISRWEGFLIWTLTNTIFCIHNFIIGQWQQSFLFLFYFLISLNGLWQYNKNHSQEGYDDTRYL